MAQEAQALVERAFLFTDLQGSSRAWEHAPRDPPAGPARLLPLWPNRQVLGEIATLRRLGHEVLLLRPGRRSLELAGLSLFSGRITSDVVEATYEAAARRIAEPDLRERLDRILASAGRPAVP